MNFKSWFILSEELYQNNTATIFHRTKSFDFVQQMMNGGFTAGTGDWHGPGLYTTYTLKGTTNLDYGPYVVKLKVKNLKEYFVLEPDVAKQIHGNDWKLKDQARILKLKLKLTDEEWQKYQEISESGDFGSAAASTALKKDGHLLWEHGCKGIVYNGRQDGKCICVYAPYEGLQFLAYEYSPAPTTVNFIEKNWVKSGKDVSIRLISKLKFPQNIGSTEGKKQYQLSDPNRIIPLEILKDAKVGKYFRLKLYLKNNKLTGNNVFDLLKDAPDKEKMAEILGTDNVSRLSDRDVRHLIISSSDNHYRQEMINLIIKYKTELSGGNIYNFISLVSDKEKMAEILGQNNIDKLTKTNVYDLLTNVSDKDQMARILGPDNINKLSGDNVFDFIRYHREEKIVEILGTDNINKLDNTRVYDLLFYANDREKMAKILGQANIDKLTGDNFVSLLFSAYDKEKMAEILGQNNIDKLDGDNIVNLFLSRSDKDQMAKILGQANIDKLDDENVNNLLGKTSDKEKMLKILGQNNINKLNGRNVFGLLNSELDKEKAARILGSNNINKLNIDQFDYLCQLDQLGPYGMKQILRKYYTGTNQEVISLLNQ